MHRLVFTDKNLIPLRPVPKERFLVPHRPFVEVRVPELLAHADGVEPEPGESNLGRDVVVVRASCGLVVNVIDVIVRLARGGDAREVRGQVLAKAGGVVNREEQKALEALRRSGTASEWARMTKTARDDYLGEHVVHVALYVVYVGHVCIVLGLQGEHRRLYRTAVKVLDGTGVILNSSCCECPGSSKIGLCETERKQTSRAYSIHSWVPALRPEARGTSHVL